LEKPWRSASISGSRPRARQSRAAAPGDTILIEKGEYFDCSIVAADRLTIEGKGDVVITDKTCEGKALFVTRGNDITLRNITFTRARVPDGNGAGIRAEGANLRIENSRFINNENGILAADSPKSSIVIVDSEFSRNGKCEPGCAHGVYVNNIALLHIERCTFTDTKAAHNIKSRAFRTEILSSKIVDGETGTSSYLVDIPNGGSLILKDNVMQKGRKTSNAATAVSIGAEGVKQKTEELLITGNNSRTIKLATRPSFAT